MILTVLPVHLLGRHPGESCLAVRGCRTTLLLTQTLTWLGHNPSTPPLDGCEPARLMGETEYTSGTHTHTSNTYYGVACARA
jgi:hypothetical protein